MFTSDFESLFGIMPFGLPLGFESFETLRDLKLAWDGAAEKN